MYKKSPWPRDRTPSTVPSNRRICTIMGSAVVRTRCDTSGLGYRGMASGQAPSTPLVAFIDRISSKTRKILQLFAAMSTCPAPEAIVGY